MAVSLAIGSGTAIAAAQAPATQSQLAHEIHGLPGQQGEDVVREVRAYLRQMNAGPEWNEAVEAVRQDLARMPEMSPEEL